MRPANGKPERLAFYDLDGTLIATNVVHQYHWYAKRLGQLGRSARLIVDLPRLAWLESRSRLRFNLGFFAHYRGLEREWLERQAEPLFVELLRPAIFRGARALIEENRAAGCRNVLVSGSLDFAIAPLARHLGLDEVVANRLVFRDGVATGEIADPVIAESAKVAAMADLARRYHVDPADCRAYSDSHSDLPMLEAVGHPSATNPDRRLKGVAKERGWPVLNLK